MERSIFREYDLRGIAGRDLSPDAYYLIGQAVGQHLKVLRETAQPSIVVGRDARVSSPGYHAALIEGLLAVDCRVTDVGMVPTPVVSFGHLKLKADGSVMVTASHNPKDYNGLKLRIRVGEASVPLYGPDIQALYQRIAGGECVPRVGGQAESEHPTIAPLKTGSLTRYDVAEDYIQAVKESLRLPSPASVHTPLRVVLDSGNGVAGPLASQLLERLFSAHGVEILGLYLEPDGRFPNHLADPTIPRLMADCSAAVVTNQAHLGIGLDGDGDRIGIVDQDGAHQAGDRLLQLLAQPLLAEHPGRAVVYDVKCSDELEAAILAQGGIPVMAPTGYPLVSKAMVQHQAILAGEMSGHIYFGDRWHGFDDGLYAAARLIERLVNQHHVADVRPIGQWLPPALKVSTPELRLPCDDRQKFEIVARLALALTSRFPVNTLDGVRMRFEDGWGLIRASNTQPVLVARFEASSHETLLQNMAVIEESLKRDAGLDVDLKHAYELGGGDHG